MARRKLTLSVGKLINELGTSEPVSITVQCVHIISSVNASTPSNLCSRYNLSCAKMWNVHVEINIEKLPRKSFHLPVASAPLSLWLAPSSLFYSHKTVLLFYCTSPYLAALCLILLHLELGVATLGLHEPQIYRKLMSV